MKVGRNDLCPCGSGKKYKRCCMDAISKQQSELFDEISQTLAMNPTLTIDELNLVTQRKVAERNNRPNDDFCGLTPTQMTNWLYAPFSELAWVKISVPEDLSTSPVMRYLSLIFDEMITQGGSMKATAKGNLPAKLVQQASELLPEFAATQYEIYPRLSEFAGSIEAQFNALHYTRIQAELAGIIYFERGRFYFSEGVQQRYQQQGLASFFLPLLEASVKQYNWGYMDLWPEGLRLEIFWLFMLWRLQSHGSVPRLIKEAAAACPDFLKQFPDDAYFSQHDQLGMVLMSRFLTRFLQFWGFVAVDPRRFIDGNRVLPQVTILPLLNQSFRFSV